MACHAEEPLRTLNAPWSMHVRDLSCTTTSLARLHRQRPVGPHYGVNLTLLVFVREVRTRKQNTFTTVHGSVLAMDGHVAFLHGQLQVDAQLSAGKRQSDAQLSGVLPTSSPLPVACGGDMLARRCPATVSGCQQALVMSILRP